MTKGNNAIPKVHQRKHWTPGSSQKGNYKTFLSQPKKAEARRRLRLQKAKKIFPRPLKMLKPAVACPTVRYNMRKRLGRGFTPAEIKAAGSNPRYVATVGVSVDARRKNISQQSLDLNAQRLKSYLDKLVVFPLSKKAVAKTDASAEVQKAAKQARKIGASPASIRAAAAPARKVAKAETEKSAYKFLKKNLSAVRFMGERMVRQQKKLAKEKAAKEKEAKK